MVDAVATASAFDRSLARHLAGGGRRFISDEAARALLLLDERDLRNEIFIRSILLMGNCAGKLAEVVIVSRGTATPMGRIMEFCRLPAYSYRGDEVTEFGAYHVSHPPQLIENSTLRVATEPFELSARITPTARHYGMIASHDKAGDSPFQFRFEIYPSMRVSLACPGTGMRGSRSDGDPNGYRSEVVTGALPLNAESHLRVTRDATGRFSIYVNDVASTFRFHSLAPANLRIGDIPGRTFRIGSRRDRRSSIKDVFQGTITDAYLVVPDSS
tara:strand:- start:1965 stop:2780 length:816 start_codon:yes stop_codon:yes gene_type:complete